MPVHPVHPVHPLHPLHGIRGHFSAVAWAAAVPPKTASMPGQAWLFAHVVSHRQGWRNMGEAVPSVRIATKIPQQQVANTVAVQETSHAKIMTDVVGIAGKLHGLLDSKHLSINMCLKPECIYYTEYPKSGTYWIASLLVLARFASQCTLSNFSEILACVCVFQEYCLVDSTVLSTPLFAALQNRSRTSVGSPSISTKYASIACCKQSILQPPLRCLELRPTLSFFQGPSGSPNLCSLTSKEHFLFRQEGGVRPAKLVPGHAPMHRKHVSNVLVFTWICSGFGKCVFLDGLTTPVAGWFAILAFHAGQVCIAKVLPAWRVQM